MTDKDHRVTMWSKYVHDLYLHGRYKFQDTLESPSIYTHLLDENCVLLDLGCGDGRFSILSSNKAKTVISVDLALSGLLFLKRYIKKKRILNICPILASAYSLPLKTSSVDSLLFVYVIEHLKDPQKVLNEIARVSKRNRQLILSTDTRIFYDLYQLLFKRVAPDPTHKNLMFPFQVKKLLNKNFRVEKEFYFQGRMMRVLHKLVPIFCIGMIFVARKR